MLLSNLKHGRGYALCCLVFTVLISTNTRASAAPLCVQLDSDPDGDGWGWENSQSCIFEASQAVSPAVPAAATLSIRSTLVCSSQASDPDNDGWGWENGQSCKVGSADETVLPNVVKDSDGGSLFCKNPASDHDNDGWGWENNASCIAAPLIAVPVDKTVDIDFVNSATPTCSATIVDDNNDGWGWENGQSCVISTAMISQKIMAVGDSITHGVRGQTSYRKPLSALLTQGGCDYEFVGSQTSNYGHNGFNGLHEGYSSQTADQFLVGHSGDSGDNQGISQSMAVFNPDVVLLHIGTNDMRLEQSIDDTISEIDQIISSIHESNSAAVVLLANVIPWYLSAQAAVETLGDRIEAHVAQLANPLVKLVDVRSGYSLDLMIWDKAHPNAAGDAHIADAFFNSYDESGLCNN